MMDGLVQPIDETQVTKGSETHFPKIAEKGYQFPLISV